MQNLSKGRFGGFTLIELLVVVLVIGILSAIALPQYQKAVEKSRVATMQPLVRSLADAQTRYILANGEVARVFADLDIALPGICQTPITDAHYGERVKCGKFSVYLDSSGHQVAGAMGLGDESDVLIYYPTGTGQGFSNNRTCFACNGTASSRADTLCLNLGGVYKGGSSTGCSNYTLP